MTIYGWFGYMSQMNQDKPDHPSSEKFLRWPAEAKTLREFVLVRALTISASDGGIGLFYLPGILDDKTKGMPIPELDDLNDMTLAEGMSHLLSEHPGLVSNISFKWPGPQNGNPELPPFLQDLGNLIADEMTKAGDLSIDYVSEHLDLLYPVSLESEHVRNVIYAMQRELDREGMSRGMPLVLDRLPYERQEMLVWRRRYWYAKFGITPETWQRGTFNLADVEDMLYPEDVRKKHDYVSFSVRFYGMYGYGFG
jgi:hypothetical protein